MDENTKRVLASIGGGRLDFAPGEIQPDTLPLSILSYALAGEDLALRRVFKRKLAAGHRGIYVDVGCSAPVSISNTFLFYCLGWSGICVDASNDQSELWARCRPRDTFVHSAVGENPGQTFLYKHKKNSGMHRISNSVADFGEEFEATPTQVSMNRLDSILAKNLNESEIDFMSIDVEDSELGVLKSNDWIRWRPHVVLMESTRFTFNSPMSDPAVRYLADKGYILSEKVGENVLMICSEKNE